MSTTRLASRVARAAEGTGALDGGRAEHPPTREGGGAQAGGRGRAPPRGGEGHGGGVPIKKGWGHLPRDSGAPGHPPRSLRIRLVARPPWGCTASGSLSAPPHPTRALPRAHPGGAHVDAEVAPAEALMSLVDISRWCFLLKKTVQSDTMETTVPEA